MSVLGSLAGDPAAHMSPSSIKRIEVVAGLILRQQRLLVCQRREDAAFPFKWEFPGGKVERGEADIEALQRELKEELGIEVQECRQVFTHTHRYPGGLEVSLRFYRVRRYDGAVGNRVFRQISWVGIDELSELNFLEGDLPLIRKLTSPERGTLLS